jgi:hypothetical protein
METKGRLIVARDIKSPKKNAVMWNFILETFMGICREIRNLFKIVQKISGNLHADRSMFYCFRRH